MCTYGLDSKSSRTRMVHLSELRVEQNCEEPIIYSLIDFSYYSLSLARESKPFFALYCTQFFVLFLPMSVWWTFGDL